MSQTQDSGDELLIPKAMAMQLEIPEELLMDYGVIPDMREHRPIPWRTRLRWKAARLRTSAAETRLPADSWP